MTHSHTPTIHSPKMEAKRRGKEAAWRTCLMCPPDAPPFWSPSPSVRRCPKHQRNVDRDSELRYCPSGMKFRARTSHGGDVLV